MANKRPAFGGDFPAPPIRPKRATSPMDSIIGGPPVAGSTESETRMAAPQAEEPTLPSVSVRRTTTPGSALEPSPPSREPQPKVVQTFRIEADILDKLKDAAYWERTTLTDVANEAIAEKLRRLEERNGGPFPKRPRELRNLKAGRPTR